MKRFFLISSLFSILVLLLLSLLYLNVQDSAAIVVLFTLTGPGIGFAIASIIKDFKEG